MKKIELNCIKPDKILNIVSTQIEGLSYSLANKILRKKDIRVNDEKISDNVSVNFGDKITVFAPDDYNKATVDKSKFFDIVFEDNDVIIANKFKGIEVCSPTESLTVENFLNEKSKVYPLTRLDRNTEGLIILATHKTTFEKLRKAMKNGEKKKYYLT